jgi:hypothetical protein
MRLSSGCSCAALAAGLLFAVGAEAGVISTAGQSTLSNKSIATLTAGQRTILMRIDPFNISSFQLDVSFEAEKVQLIYVTGVNGYTVDQDFQVITDGNFGKINNIHGFWPGFNDRDIITEVDGPSTFDGPVGGAPPSGNPPPGEIDIIELLWLDLRPDLDKTFGAFATDLNDFVMGYDPETGNFTSANGPIQPNGQGIVPAFSTILGLRPGDPGWPGGPGNSVPLPGALLMGLLGGIGVMGNRLRRARAA